MNISAFAPQFISNDPMPYDWGIVDGIAERIGAPKTGGKQAELWLGSHPIRPSVLRDGGTVIDLENQGAGSLPFLLKVLAIGEVLSIQAHPTAADAQAGYARENAAGIAITASHRNYKDPNPKPEMVVALDDGFEALCGFRELVDARELYSVLQRTPGLSDSEVADLARLEVQLTSGSFGDVVSWILTAGDEVRPLRASLGHALEVYSETADNRDNRPSYLSKADDFALCTLAKIHRQYPDDPGVIFASLLNIVRLNRGESLWLGAGTPHAYLSGYAVELMGPSDNVLRGGLTKKHVDSVELCKSLKFAPQPATRLEPQPTQGELVYRPEFTADDGVKFELVRVERGISFSSKTPSCVVVIDGIFTVADKTSPLLLHRSDAAWIPAGDVVISGAGLCFVATDYGNA